MAPIEPQTQKSESLENRFILPESNMPETSRPNDNEEEKEELEANEDFWPDV